MSCFPPSDPGVVWEAAAPHRPRRRPSLGDGDHTDNGYHCLVPPPARLQGGIGLDSVCLFVCLFVSLFLMSACLFVR